MNAMGRRNLGAMGLGALLLGLLTSPWVYATFFGALSAFASPFAAVVTPLLLGATLDLALEAFGRLRGFRRIRLFGVTVSATVVLASLWVLSKFTLLNPAARLGLFATTWLGATLTWLVISVPLREVGPEALLRPHLTSPARQRIALATALILLGVLFALAWHYLMTPTGFIGGPPSPDPIG